MKIRVEKVAKLGPYPFSGYVRLETRVVKVANLGPHQFSGYTCLGTKVMKGCEGRDHRSGAMNLNV